MYDLDDSLFKNINRKKAYYEFLDSTLPDGLVDFKKEFLSFDLNYLVETVIEYGSAAIKITISDTLNSSSVYVLFDSEHLPYGVGEKTITGEIHPKIFSTSEKTIEEIKLRLKKNIINW